MGLDSRDHAIKSLIWTVEWDAALQVLQTPRRNIPQKNIVKYLVRVCSFLINSPW